MATSQMDWDKEVKLEKLEDMITVYEEHIQNLEKENKELKAQVVFLKEQLAYKTFGKPSHEDDK
jgi:predicted RNase H-like nuclease (RuvC/YqgF family)